MKKEGAGPLGPSHKTPNQYFLFFPPPCSLGFFHKIARILGISSKARNFDLPEIWCLSAFLVLLTNLFFKLSYSSKLAPHFTISSSLRLLVPCFTQLPLVQRKSESHRLVSVLYYSQISKVSGSDFKKAFSASCKSWIYHSLGDQIQLKKATDRAYIGNYHSLIQFSQCYHCLKDATCFKDCNFCNLLFHNNH